MAIDEMKQEAELHRGAIKGWEDRWRGAVELADKIQVERDEAHKEREDQVRLLGIGSEREAKLMAERDLWRAEAQRWRKQVMELEGQIEAEIQRLQWRQHQLERGIKELKG